jgi:hypothetical protein
LRDTVAGLPGEDSISNCWVRWRERFRDGDIAVIKTFSIVVKFIKKWLPNRFFCLTIPVILKTYPDLDCPVACRFNIINEYKDLQNNTGSGNVLSHAYRKFFPQKRFLQEKVIWRIRALCGYTWEV